MSIDLWSQFVDYLSAPSIGGFVRWVVPAFSGVLLIVKNIQVIITCTKNIEIENSTSYHIQNGNIIA